jgi:hypothetical protein
VEKLSSARRGVMTDLSGSIEGQSVESIASYFSVSQDKVTEAIISGAKTYQDVYSHCRGEKLNNAINGAADAFGKFGKTWAPNPGQVQVIKMHDNPMAKGSYRNHPCICGSGKKMKHCHGQERQLRSDEFDEVMRLGREHNQRVKEFDEMILAKAQELAKGGPNGQHKD